MKAQRQVWGETLAELSKTDSRIVILDGDLGTSTKADIMAKDNPDAFVQVGIAEQNMVGMAVGMSTVGYRPWLSTFGVFLTNRALDQIRMLVSQTKAPVRLAAAYSGLLNGAAGKTHQDIEDLAVMRAMPNMTVLAPADEYELEAMVRWAAEFDGPLYIRVARDPVVPVFTEAYEFELGKPRLVREGSDVTLISTGVQTSRTVEAADLLQEQGVSARVIHLPSLKPLDEQELLSLIGNVDRVFTVEEHTKINGLGSLVAELLVESDKPTRLTRIGLEDGWSESGPNDFLLDKYGISPKRVAEQVLAVRA
ncbi:MAG: transketolase family protein [Gulosibacter sp.]|uniref:transketolase family protein n=1 Tax=Gulosibacter sp. TaxID=2817531 RepID=UPI003F913F2C